MPKRMRPLDSGDDGKTGTIYLHERLFQPQVSQRTEKGNDRMETKIHGREPREGLKTHGQIDLFDAMTPNTDVTLNYGGSIVTVGHPIQMDYESVKTASHCMGI